MDWDYPLDPAKDVKCKDFKTSDYLRVTDRYRLRWLDVPYEPGELKVVAYRQGRRTGETQVRTAGPVERVRLVADPYNSSDARTVFVQVEVVDAAGTADPHAAGRVRFAVDGGELLAVGNGNPFSFESFCADNCLLFNGRAVAVVRRSGTNIPVRIVARVEGLEKGCLEL